MTGTHAEIVSWLERQLFELQRWRGEVLLESGSEKSLILTRLEAHCRWLEKELIRLTGARTAA